jgi:hypothetical protein
MKRHDDFEVSHGIPHFETQSQSMAEGELSRASFQQQNVALTNPSMPK